MDPVAEVFEAVKALHPAATERLQDEKGGVAEGPLIEEGEHARRVVLQTPWGRVRVTVERWLG